MTRSDSPRVAFVQDNARLHYAFPLALQQHDMLERMFTNWYTSPGSPEAIVARLVRWVDSSLGDRMLGRRHPELDSRRIVTNRWLLLRQRFGRRRFSTIESFYQACAAQERDWILRRGWGSANVLGGFVRNMDPGLCRAAREAGLRVVVDQIIAPATMEQREADEQQRRWPGWEPPVDSSTVAAGEQATWEAAHHITCASDYVCDGLTALGHPRERITVNPYPVAAPELQLVDRTGRDGMPVVGFIGQIGLRKGAPYFLEVARKLAGRARFVMVGPVAVSREISKTFHGAVELPGPVPRSQVRHWLEQFDILLFPSTCEGSPSSVAEAMLTGLPIVTSPNSGTLVRDGVEGFVAAYDDIPRLAESVRQLIDDPALRQRLGRQARARAMEHDLSAFSARLAAIMRQVLAE